VRSSRAQLQAGCRPAVFTKAKLLKDLGNQAVHSTRPIRQYERANRGARAIPLLLLAYPHLRAGTKPADGLAFDPNLLPRTSPVPPQTLAQLQTLAAQFADKDTKLAALLSDKAALDEELQRLREEVAQARTATLPGRTHTTTPRPRPATTSLICCSRKRAGPWTSRRTASLQSAVCLTSKAQALWTTYCGRRR